jgi:hypothetical protein
MRLPGGRNDGPEGASGGREKRRRDRAERAARRARAKAEKRANAEAVKRAKAQVSRPPSRLATLLRRGERTAPEQSEPRAKAPSAERRASADPRRAAGASGAVAVELVKLVREMLVIPAQLWMALAELAGAATLAVWRRAVRPALVATLRLARAIIRVAERHVTPARAVAVVALATLAALAASQWLDYRTISVGTGAYSGDVGAVAPAPEIDTATAGSAHAWVMLPLAAAGIAALAFAVARRPGAARLLVIVGVAAIAISLIVDAPKGLDEGTTAVAYEGAKARLLEGFWLQIVTGGVLIACGLMLPRYLRPAPAASRHPATRPPSPAQRLIARARAELERGLASAHGPRPPRRRRAPRPRLPTRKRKVQGAGT